MASAREVGGFVLCEGQLRAVQAIGASFFEPLWVRKWLYYMLYWSVKRCRSWLGKLIAIAFQLLLTFSFACHSGWLCCSGCVKLRAGLDHLPRCPKLSYVAPGLGITSAGCVRTSTAAWRLMASAASWPRRRRRWNTSCGRAWCSC